MSATETTRIKVMVVEDQPQILRSLLKLLNESPEVEVIASALSGFVRDRYVFSVLQNGRPVSYLWARRAQDRFATVLASE